ncbi:MAG: hypothetical protein PF484_07970 [Bacteroidales bacterium]|jgi:hypothetical protein|nr:hypothetical protein [Bacteroidales bacterium]
MKPLIKILCLFILVALFMPLRSYSQKVKTAKGIATVKIEAHLTKLETRNKAMQLAIINAIENEFGTYVEQEADITIVDGKTSFSLIGSTKVKGEWIETIKENYTETSREIRENGETKVEVYITCEIKGKVREILPKASLEYELLNCPQLECRTRTFLVNEQLYLYFRSPVDGYLSVFVDESTIIRRILPYSFMPDIYQNGIEIKADKEYLFFSPKHNSFSNSVVDEMILYTIKNEERITLVLAFSEKPFKKPILNEIEKVGDLILPKSLSANKFTEWLIDNRSTENSFQDLNINFQIINPN